MYDFRGIQMDKLLLLLDKYRCDLRRGSISTEKYLKENFSSYIVDVKSAIDPKENLLVGEEMCCMVADKIDEIESNAKSLINVLSLYNKGKYVPASIEAFKTFDLMKYQLMQRYSGAYRREVYYRIRRFNDEYPFEMDRKELFHIPYNKNYLVGTERYSMPGHPCLYLSSQAELCWYECGKPEKFAISKFDIPQDEDNNLRFIDFSEKLMPLMYNFVCWFNNEKDKELVRKYLLKYIYTYPLRAACSVIVEHPGSNFIEEYIIPQLLLQWVLNDDDFDGIRYESCSSSDEVRSMGGHNIVLVTNSFDSEGFDINLRRIIGIGEPMLKDLNKINLEDLINPLNENIKETPFLWDLYDISNEYCKL